VTSLREQTSVLSPCCGGWCYSLLSINAQPEPVF
jgi:hypothetical protein